MQEAKVQIVNRLGLNEQSQVVEIGSNDGYLLQYFAERDHLSLYAHINMIHSEIKRN